MKRGTGALASEIDPRTVKHSDLASAGAPLVKGGISYLPQDIEDQWTVGICTAADIIQNRQKANGKKYSIEFQYLLQKKFYDLNWNEGSSNINALKVGFKYGFLPAYLWTFTTEQDRKLPYAQYIAKLQAITDAQIQSLLLQCIDKIAGYAIVDVSNPQAIALAINESGVGILCRYVTGPTWWTGVNGISSWQPKDIDPIRYPVPAPDAHSITSSAFDFTLANMFEHPNTWGIDWDLQGRCHINWDNYKMTEGWIILGYTPPVNQFPTLRLGSLGGAVKDLQTKINKKLGCNLGIDGQFGPQTLREVKLFQSQNNLVADGVVGPLTWGKLNI